MRALANHLGTWDAFRATTGKRGAGGLTFSMHIVDLIGKPHGLELSVEEPTPDAIFFAIHEFSSALLLGKELRRLKIPLLSADRKIGEFPLLWAGGQGTFNPLPIANIVDLVVLGDAEDSLPELLREWHSLGNSKRFLERAANVPGVFVPSVHDEHCDKLVRGYARDVSITLQGGVIGRQARVEISRGCQKKCSFCGLGWMGKPRHNDALKVLNSISGIPSVHLQSCDAEGHPQIKFIRESMFASGQIDTGCTASLDEAFDAGSSLYYDKMYNFGIEAATERVRKAIGKPRLTNAFIADATVDLFKRYHKYGVDSSRVAWHMIAGLPGETRASIGELATLLRDLDSRMLRRDKVVGFVQVRWQPMFPQPGTPTQWLAPGLDAEQWSYDLKRAIGKTYALKLSHVGGRRNEKNLMTVALTRSWRNGTEIIASCSGKAKPSAHEAAELTASELGPIDPSAPLPWDFIDGQISRRQMEIAHRKLVSL